MSQSFSLQDSLAAADLQTYLSRAARVEEGSVRLIAGSGVLAVIFRMVDLPAPFGPTTPILAPGRNAIVTSSRITLSPTALRALTIE